MTEERNIENIPPEETKPEEKQTDSTPPTPPSAPAPESRVEEKPHSQKGRNMLTVALAALLILSLGVSAYIYFDSNQRVSQLSGQVSTLSASLNQSNSQVEALIQTVNNLKPSSGGSTGGNTITQIYNDVKNSVVLITSTLPQGTATGSGFVYDTEGKIVTNDHVIDGANSITVTFINGTIVPATVVGADPYSDIAVIKVDAPAALLQPLRLGNSSALSVGEGVLAIGNPYGLADTLTSGIVSALSREMTSESGYTIADVIQTDAAINPGNSGGPLLNMNGEVVGINTAIPSSTSSGIGFAVPSNTILRELPSLIGTGKYDQVYIGIQGTDLTPGIVSAMNLPAGTFGTLLTTVTKGGPADKAGLKGGSKYVVIDGSYVLIGGDVIVKADGQLTKSMYDLILYLQRYKRPGDTIDLTIIRGGSEMVVSVTLGTRTG